MEMRKVGEWSQYGILFITPPDFPWVTFFDAWQMRYFFPEFPVPLDFFLSLSPDVRRARFCQMLSHRRSVGLGQSIFLLPAGFPAPARLIAMACSLFNFQHEHLDDFAIPSVW